MRVGLALLLLLVGVEAVRADPPSAPSAPPAANAAPPPTPEQAADAVLVAIRGKDDATLAAIAAREEPDPWIVADELLRRREGEAAATLATASSRADLAALPAYVSARTAKSEDAAMEKARVAYGASMRETSAAKALPILDGVEPPAGEVVSVLIALRRGKAHLALGRVEAGTAALIAAGEAARGMGWLQAASGLLQQGATAAYQRADFERALDVWEKRLRVEEARGNRVGIAASLSNFGLVYRSLGDFAKALQYLERGRRAFEELGRKDMIARSWTNIGAVQRQFGEYAKALASARTALELFEATGDRKGAASAELNLGAAYAAVGDEERALASYERAKRAFQEVGDRGGFARALVDTALVLVEHGEFEQARKTFEVVLPIFDALGDRAGSAQVSLNMGRLHALTGDARASVTALKDSLARFEALGMREDSVFALAYLGIAHRSLGESDESLAVLDRAAREAERIRSSPLIVLALEETAWTRLGRGEAELALAAARRGMPYVDSMVAGEDPAHGTSARSEHTGLFAAGGAAAEALARPADVAYFLESGRAGSLLEELGSREAILSAVLPEKLRLAEAAARAAEAGALARLREVGDAGPLETVREARQNHEAASARRQALIEEIQRDAKASSTVFCARAATLEELQKWLRDDEALVLYGLLGDRASALVVTRKSARIASLGSTRDLEAACSTLDADDAKSSPEPAIRRLREALVEPLRLEASVRRVLVSPEGALCYLPFALLAPDREVVLVPSGTTYAWLLEDRSPRGQGVLALGDPDYESGPDERAAGIYARGVSGRLTRLPATAAEAKAVGDIVLLEKDATESALSKVLATKPRWRAVHFACHGLLNSERPAFSSLALTAAGDDDGFLTLLEVFRSKVPADLVVLSACETAKGKFVKGEGIVGLTRAFMFAGAPRVICSLWKVDDEATRALMTKFYELWNPKGTDAGKPGVPTAEALRKAQEFVRSHEKWKHPYYWAAWVLWGLPS